ncbi:hypothetical protein ACLOJK_027649 [Asimina triloba]
MGASALNTAATGHRSKREEVDAVGTMLLKMERSLLRIDLGFLQLDDQPTLDQCWPLSNLGGPLWRCCLGGFGIFGALAARSICHRFLELGEKLLVVIRSWWLLLTRAIEDADGLLSICPCRRRRGRLVPVSLDLCSWPRRRLSGRVRSDDWSSPDVGVRRQLVGKIEHRISVLRRCTEIWSWDLASMSCVSSTGS